MSDPRVEGLRHDDDGNGNYESDRQIKKMQEEKVHRFQCFYSPKRGKNNSDDGRNSSSKFSSRGRGRGSRPDAFGCFSCIRIRKQSSESIVEAQPQSSDPNSSEFTQEMVRDLIEKNDFYSKECNPYVFD